MRARAVILAVSGGLMMIGSILPWARATQGTFTVAGTAGDGTITLVIGVILIALGLVSLTSTHRAIGIIAAVVAIAALAAAVYDGRHLASVANDTGDFKVGEGVILVGVAAAIAIVASLIIATARNGPTTAAAAVSERPLRKCPYCAELVKWEAIVCKHCSRDLPAMSGYPPGYCQECGEPKARPPTKACLRCKEPFEVG